MAMPSRPPRATTPGSRQVELSDDREPSERTVLLIGVSPEMNQRLEELATYYDVDKAEVINLAVGLLKYVRDAVAEGNRVGVASPDQELEAEITGL